MDVIHTTGLTKYYGRSRGIIDLNLTVSEGEFFGFIGPNGAGKSTTIRTLLGLVKSTSGSAMVLGEDIAREKTKILAQIGYLPSEAMFYSGMRVRDILKLSANLRKKDCSAKARELCERLQLDTARKVEELSYGNRKKVAIVCALQHEPRLCILDEPTGGLDPLIQREFFAILRERNKRGTTIFLSSHVLSEIQRNCTRAAIIREGRIIACDSVEALSQTSAKRVTIHGKVDLSGLAGIRDLQGTWQGKRVGSPDSRTPAESTGGLSSSTPEGSVSFLYSGDINRLLQVLAGQQIKDLSISEPDLEEIFMHYYEKEGSAE